MKRTVFIVLGMVAILLIIGAIFLPRQRQRVLAAVGIARPQASPYETTPARLSDLTAYVSATGAVKSNKTARITWQTSGQVSAIYVQKGQTVQAGQVLAALDQNTMGQNIILAQSDLVGAQNALTTVLNNAQPRANAQVALVQAQQALTKAQKASQSATFRRASQNTIDVSRANLIVAQQSVDDATAIYNRAAARNANDPVYAAALSSLAKARQQEAVAEANLNFVMDLPAPVDIQLVYAQLDQANANLLVAKQNWDKIKDGPNPGDIAAAQAKVAAAQATLNMARLTAPFSGTIVDAGVQSGELVAPGAYAFEIDDLSRLLINVQVSEVDINSVKIGQPVNITLDAVPNQTYAGQVTDIASIGTTTNGTVNFTVTVQITNVDAQIKPAMTAGASIAVTQLHNILVVPNRVVRVVNNQRVVYVLRNNQPVPVVVNLGPSDNVNSQVVSGDLHPGDLIILNPPASLNPRGGFIFGGGAGGGNRGGNAGSGGAAGATPGSGSPAANPTGAPNPGGTQP